MSLQFSLNEEDLKIQNKAKEIFAWSEQERLTFREQIRSKKFPEIIWKRFSEANFLGCLIPKEFGGNEAGLLPLALTLEELCAQGYTNTLLMLTNMVITSLVKHGSDSLKKRFLPKLAKGEYKCCVAATEEISGNNMFRIQTFAENKKDHYLVNGSKIYISGADVADYMLLLTRTKTPEECQKEELPRTFGFSIFLVDTNSPGITKKIIPTHGESSLKQHTLHFDQLKIPAENLIGQEHAGAFAMFDAINVERILGSAMALGISRFCLQQATDYAKERVVFGKNPIGQYQAIQHPLADIRMRQESILLLLYKATTLFDEGADPLEVGFLANSAKYLSSELGLKAVDAAIETLGGKGFNEDYDLIHLWEDIRLFKTAPTSNSMILNFVAEHELRLPRSY